MNDDQAPTPAGAMSLLDALRAREAELERLRAELRRAQETCATSLAREQLLLRAVVDNMPDAIYVKDAGLRRVLCNRADLESLGLHDEREALGKTDGELMAPDEAERNEAEDRAVLARGEPAPEREERHLGPDGRPRWLLVTKAPLHDAAGRLVGLVAVRHDITRRIESEEALRESAALVQTLIDAIPAPVFYRDANSRFLGCNKAHAAFRGFSQSEIVGKSVYETSPRDLAERYARVDQELIAHPGTQSFETVAVRADGQRRNVMVHRASFNDAQGAVRGVVGVVLDITERVQAEEALRRSEERFRKAFELTPDAFSLTRAQDGLFVAVNSGFERIMGYAREEVLGRTSFELNIWHSAEDRAQVVRRLQATGEVTGFEARFVRQDGELRHGMMSAAMIDLDGVPHVLNIVRDVTDYKRDEERRLELERQLLHSQKLESLGVLAGGIAHDFNNLLAAVLGNLELASADLPPLSPAQQNLREAALAAERAADLTRQMLAYSGKGRFVVRAISLSELLRENAHLWRVVIPKNVSLELQLDEGLPPVKADAAQLQQVAMNLLINAAEAIGERPGVVTLATGVQECDEALLARSRLDDRPAPGRFAWLEVVDTGVGMDAEMQRRMFEPFYSTKFTGRGLGLAAVLGIVRGHGGAILVDSAPGRGARVRVLLPVAQAAPQPAMRQAEETPPPAPKVGPFSGTALVVDDEAMVRRYCQRAVERLGLRTLTAADGEEAVRVYREHASEIVCVILDLTMPTMDGVATFEALRSLNPQVKVILCSGYNEQVATQHLVGQGLAGFLHKPYDLRALTSELTRVLTDVQ